jgi:hypothetical protein
MKCPYLRGWIISSCVADETAFIILHFLVQEYCRSVSYKNCPYYIKADKFSDLVYT